MGTAFLYNSGNDANAIIQVGRVMPILITILTIILVYFLARRFVGKLWALLPTFLFALDPTVLAQGHYVTTDLGAAFGVVLSTIFLFKIYRRSVHKTFVVCGARVRRGADHQVLDATARPALYFSLYRFMVARSRRAMERDRCIAPREDIFRKAVPLRVEMHSDLRHRLRVHRLSRSTSYSRAAIRSQRQVSDTTAILASFATGPTPAGQRCATVCVASPMRTSGWRDIASRSPSRNIRSGS